MKNYKIRNRARYYAVQALYQKNFIDISIEKQQLEFFENNFLRHDVEWDFFNLLVVGYQENKTFIDNSIEKAFIEKKFCLGIVEYSILNLGCYELFFLKNISYKIILNEYIKIAKTLGSLNSYKLINKILDKFLHKTNEL